MTDRIQAWTNDLRDLAETHGVETIINVKPPVDKEIRLSPEVEKYLEEQGQVRRTSTNATIFTKLALDWRRTLAMACCCRPGRGPFTPVNPLLHLVCPCKSSAPHQD